MNAGTALDGNARVLMRVGAALSARSIQCARDGTGNVSNSPRIAQRFGRCVRELRLEAGLSQVEFGERCGFYQTYLSRLERGQANPTLNAMEVIANALGITIYELWERVRRT